VPVALTAARLLTLTIETLHSLAPGNAAAAGLLLPALQQCVAADCSNGSSSGSLQPQLARAATRHAIASPQATSTTSSCCVSPALQRCLQGIVLIRVAGSWATGVAISKQLIITNAHLLPVGSGARGQHEAVWVRVGGGSSSGSSSAAAGVWVPAAVLHQFSGYLDIAVLQLMAPPGLTTAAAAAAVPEPTPLQLISTGRGAEPQLGQEVFVIGHGLFGPRLGWAPSITRGSLARCVRLPGAQHGGHGGGDSSRAQGRSSMLIVTAAVHAGASGGALVDAGGRLLGLVTSNTRHHRGATLPRWSYAIAADELAALWRWAAMMEAAAGGSDRGQTGGGGAAGPAWQAQLAAVDLQDTVGHRLWALKPPGDAADGGGVAAAAAAALEAPSIAAGVDRFGFVRLRCKL